MMILATITLTFTLNNVILVMNFLSMITIVGIELSVSNIEINLLILVIYESSLLCLFLVNGILLMSSLTFNFRISVNNLLIIPFSLFTPVSSIFITSLFTIPSLSYLPSLIIPSFFLTGTYPFSYCFFFILTPFSSSILVFLFQSIHYFDSNSSLFLYFPFLFNASVLTFGFERVGNLLFDNSLFPLIVLIFLVSIVNILILFSLFNLHSSFSSSFINYSLILSDHLIRELFMLQSIASILTPQFLYLEPYSLFGCLPYSFLISYYWQVFLLLAILIFIDLILD